MKLNNLRDVFMFGKVLSAGLVIAGYAFLGVWVMNWLSEKNFGILISLLAMILITAFGIWQGYLFVTKQNKNKNSPDDILNRGKKF